MTHVESFDVCLDTFLYLFYIKIPIHSTLETHSRKQIIQSPQPYLTHQLKTYSLAIVEYDCAVGPAIMVYQAQVGKDAHTHCL